MKVVNEAAPDRSDATASWISGIHAVRRRLEMHPDGVLAIKISRRRTPRLLELFHLAARAGVRVEEVDEAALGRVAGTTQHQGVAALARPLGTVSLESVCTGGRAPVLVLDQIQDPHNLGALLRSAAALGMSAVILPKHGSAGVTPAVERVSAGAVNDVPLCRVTNVARALAALKKGGFWTAGLVPRGGQPLFEASIPDPVALVLGGEDGLRPLVEKQCDFRVTIPMRTGVESLNASVAGAIAMYELRRRHSVPERSANLPPGAP